MMRSKRKLRGQRVLFWLIAIGVTLAFSIYQRMTGPTHPKHLTVEIAGNHYSWRLPRSGGITDCEVLLKDLGTENQATLYWKRYPSEEPYIAERMHSQGSGLVAELPVQPAAGKLAYYLEINGKPYFQEDPLIIRFKGEVPPWALIPHILFMFGAMLIGCYTLILALANRPVYRTYLLVTFLILLVGGFILGPLVQKYAFQVYWSGFPFGSDLTDNKTLIAMLTLLIALIMGGKKWSRWVTVMAILVFLVVFSIPHSLKGSQYNHATGQIETATGSFR